MTTVNYVTVKPDHCKNWEKSGKNETTELFSNDEGKGNFDSGNKTGVQRAWYEVIHHVIGGRLKPEQFTSLLLSVKEKNGDICSMTVDVLSMVDVELGALDDKKGREKFVSLISSCKDEIGVGLLKERLDVETLETLGLITSTKLFQQKYIKTKTRLFYKQQKFNLLREEMEGYSKLSVELGDLHRNRVTVSDLLHNIKGLIGCFNIDPNRVLDLILESFECHPELAREIFVPLVDNYLILCERSTLCHLLGFKFQHYQSSKLPTPSSLYNVAALLIQHNLVTLDDLLLHLTPNDEDLHKEWDKYVEETTEEARRSTVMVLNPTEKKEEKTNQMDVDKPLNQKFGLCEALLLIGDWENTQKLLNKFSWNQLISYKPIATAMCKLGSYLLDPLYKKVGLMKGSRSSKISYPAHCSPPIPASSFNDLPTSVFPLMRRLGPYASLDPVLLMKVARTAKSFMKEYHSANSQDQQNMCEIYGGWLDMISIVLLPSLSLLPCNANISEEIWMVIKSLTYQTRYRLYGEWKNLTYEKYPQLLLAKSQTIDRTKYIMRRLTKENVKQTGRQMGKLSHSNPTILFDCILSQIQRYDNLIMPVVDALKYLTNLTYDVLAFCIIEALANPLKERMKHDDTNISNWLQSLASFCGAIFKKYPIELSGLLQYVANQLKAGKSLDLLIMKEVVQKMSGIEISEEITSDQLEALAGGEILKAEGGYFGQIRNTKKSSNRLKEALIEQNLAIPLCLLMAQQRQGIVFHESSDIHLKLVGKLTDQCHDTLVQFGNFLAIQLGIDEYLRRFPAIDVLAADFHTPSDVAFFLSRPMFSHQINTKYDELRKVERSKPKSDQNKTQRYIDAADLVITPICSLVSKMHSNKVWLDISPRFYTTFWTLNLYDIEVPKSAYSREISKLKTTIQGIEHEGSHDTRKKREKERCENLIQKLKEEEKKQEDYRNRVRARFESERAGWFLAKTTKNDTITKFLQLCVFPRSIFSPLDAVYCAKFIHILHQLKTPNFSTLLCFDRIFSDISYTVASLTENEASRYGRFLCTMLEIARRWHADKSTYDKECGNFPGFVTVLRANNADGASKANQLDYENFRHVCHKWQYKLTKAVVVCLESKEYTQIRNALMILTKILPHFPVVTSLAGALEKRIDKIRTEEKEKRPDLFALAMGYSGMLKTKKPSLIPEHEFHNKATPKSAKSAAGGGEKTTDKSAKDRGKSREKSAKRKSDDGHNKEKKDRGSVKPSADRAKSKEKLLAAGDASNHVRTHKEESSRKSLEKSSKASSSHKTADPQDGARASTEREHKRRKLDSSATAAAKDVRAEKKEKDQKRKNVEKEVTENGLSDDAEQRKSRKSKERKRELMASPKEPESVKRLKAENGDRRSKEKEKPRKESRVKKENDSETRRERMSKERSGKSEREYPFP
uniref:THO complex subunit 2 n=1 Tax=Phallusia mammillata TaxID=59560 RepID=A0A6F9DVE4_9ASCI|nr:THO complex subunit 2-like [Phallusia mammillata]